MYNSVDDCPHCNLWLLAHSQRFNNLSDHIQLPAHRMCSHPCILLLIFLLLLGQEPVVLVAQWQETSPGASLVFLAWDSVVGHGIQLLGGVALGVQLAVHLRGGALLRATVQDFAAFHYGMDVANWYR